MYIKCLVITSEYNLIFEEVHFLYSKGNNVLNWVNRVADLKQHFIYLRVYK